MNKKIKDMSVKEIMYETELSEIKAEVKRLRDCFAIMLGVVSGMGLAILCQWMYIIFN